MLTHKEWLRRIRRLPHCHIPVSVTRPKLVALSRESNPVDLCEYARGPDVLHGLQVGPFPHSDGAVLAAGHVCWGLNIGISH